MEDMMEERIYKIKATNSQFKALESMFGYIQYLGSVGHSTKFELFVDGDGSARIKVFTYEGTSILDVNNNREIIKSKMDKNSDIKSFCLD